MYTAQVTDHNGREITVSVLESSAGTPTLVSHNNRTYEINWGSGKYHPVD